MDAEEGLLFMQEMVELSKLQSEKPDAAAQAVSFQMRDGTGVKRKVTVQAGPSRFGKVLLGNDKVTAQTTIVHPFNGCSEPLLPHRIKGKIAIMERGSCMFMEKARNVENAGAVGAIIVDNTPGTSAATSPMFSMSGDGNDDVHIPTVFLFSQDASKLLLALSKDATTEVTISEYKGETDVWPQNEDESVFQKLKLSVQEFLNKHAGIAFTQTVSDGGFKAYIGLDKIRIVHENIEENQVPTEKVTNPQWSQIRKGLLKSILHSETHELFVPINILRIYYQTLSKADEIRSHDIVQQTKWLLNELNIEHHREEDDSLIKPEKDNIVSAAANDNIEMSSSDNDQKLETLNDILGKISNIQKDLIDELSKSSDDRVLVSQIKNSKHKVILTKEQLDTSETRNSGSDLNKKNHVVDEL